LVITYRIVNYRVKHLTTSPILIVAFLGLGIHFWLHRENMSRLATRDSSLEMGLQPLSTSPSTSTVPDSSPPQPLSLSQILRLHPRERLLVHPLQWTARHLELLQCSFDAPAPADGRRLRHEPPHGERRAAKLAYRMTSTYGSGFRERDIRDLLAHQDGPLKSIKFVVRSQRGLTAPPVLTRCSLGAGSCSTTAGALSAACPV
jgi:hypothetical protein